MRWSSRLPTWALWLLFLSIALIAVVLPYAHFIVLPSLLGSYYGIVRTFTLVALAVWSIGRPLLVVFTDRKRHDTPAAPPIGVSVVVPCHNSSDSIGFVVESLLAQTHRPIEIVLVENNSTDETWEVINDLATAHPEVRPFSVRPKPGVYAASVAINFGVLRASHPVILRLDDDTHIARDAIARALSEMVAQGAVAVACDLRVANPHASIWTRLQALEYLFAMDIDRRTQDVFGSILCCSGGMALFDREMIINAGGFVSAPKEVSEDMDMTLKAHRAGLVCIAPESIGFTSVPETIEGVSEQRFRWGISGTVALYIHRRGLLNRSYWHLGPIGFVGLPLRAATALRDLLGPIFLADVALLMMHDGPKWLMFFLLARIATIWVQMLALRPALHRDQSLQGLDAWWLSPVFVLLYGPYLLFVRCAGSWAGVHHVIKLRGERAAKAKAQTPLRVGGELIVRLADPVPDQVI